MKVQVDLDIDLPRDQVLELYRNPDNLKNWFIGFREFNHLSGRPCAIGSRFEVKFRVGNMNISVEEKITRNDLPEEIWYEEHTEGITNLQKNLFIDVGENTTKWVIISNYESDYIKHIGLSAFKKKTLKFMNSFKRFAESQVLGTV